MPNLSHLCPARRNVPGSGEMPDMCELSEGHTIPHIWLAPVGRWAERQNPEWIKKAVVYHAKSNRIQEPTNDRSV